MTHNNIRDTKRKPKIFHSDNGHRENGKPTKEYQLIVRTADRIFNSPSTATTTSRPKRNKRK